MRKHVSILAIALVASAVTCGCSDGPADDTSKGPGGGADSPTWTIFVYGHADHSLSNSLVTDMAEMTRAKLSEDVRVVVLADWDASATNSADETSFPSGSEWYEIRGNDEPPRQLSTGPEKNLDDPAELTAAIQKAFTDYPADRYGLILWDHGGAWDHGYGGDSQDGTEAPSGMPVPTLASAIQGGLSGAGLSGTRPLEFLSFDTCLMQTAEVAFAMKEFAKVYIANAEIDYGDGWNYEDTLTFLAQNPGIAPLDFAKEENKFWNEQHLKAGMDDRLLRAHAALDMSKLGAVASASDALVDGFAVTPGAALPFARAAYFDLPAYSATFADGQNIPHYRDQGMLMALLQADGTLSAEAGALGDAIRNAVIASSLGELRNGQLGVQIGLPSIDKIDPVWLDAYETKASAWNGASRWSEILGGVAAGADGEGPVIEHALENGDAPGAADLPTVVFQIPDDDIAMVRFNLVKTFSEDPGKLLDLGVITAGIVEPNEIYEMVWSGQIASIGTGDEAQPASVFPWMMPPKDAQSGAMLPPILAVPGILEVSQETVQAYLLFADGDAAASVVIVQEGGQSVAFEIDQLAIDMPGVTFAPTIAAADPNEPEGTQMLAGTALPLPATGGVPVGGAAAPPGEYSLLTVAIDVWGNESVVVDRVTVPSAF